MADVAQLLGKTTRITGTPEQIADRLEDWARAGIDGVNVMYSTTPGSFIDFIDYLARELQRRGLMQREYSTGTLREKLFGAGPYLPDLHIGRSFRAWDSNRTRQAPVVSDGNVPSRNHNAQ